jgi:hypothetical protein
LQPDPGLKQTPYPADAEIHQRSKSLNSTNNNLANRQQIEAKKKFSST